MRIRANELQVGMTFSNLRRPDSGRMRPQYGTFVVDRELLTVLAVRPAQHTDPTYRILIDVVHHGVDNSPARVWHVNIPRNNWVEIP